MQGAGRVGRDELDQHLAALGLNASAEPFGLFEDAKYHCALGLGLEAQVDEARTRDLGRLDQFAGLRGQHRVDQRLGNRAGIALERLGHLQREIAGQVAVIGLLGAIECRAGAGHGVDERRVVGRAGEVRGRCLEGSCNAQFVFG